VYVNGDSCGFGCEWFGGCGGGCLYQARKKKGEATELGRNRAR